MNHNVEFAKGADFKWCQHINWSVYTQIFILVDENTERDCLPLILPFLPVEKVIIKVIKSGEEQKNIRTCLQIWEFMTQHHLDRKALVLNLGGGVIGDMGGFCAAAYKRGVSFINVPTTLLAQVDASIGGKLGIDFHGYKNHIGFFKEPKNVFIDVQFLKTLPAEQLKSGFAEIIKHCLIKDANAFETLQKKTFPNLDFQWWIKHSIHIKSTIVTADPFEKGVRKVLNFGHTIGHAIETYFLNLKKPFLHGEAVAMGMMAETYLSVKKLGLKEEEANKIYKFITSIFPNKTSIKAMESIDTRQSIALLAKQDKKNQGDKISSVLLNTIGDAQYDIIITIDDILDALDFYIHYN